MINPATFPSRLKSARLMQGYTLRSLVEAIEQIGGQISTQAISKYENGVVTPTTNNFFLLCEALEVSIDFFTRPAIQLEEVEFRKLKKLPQKEQHRIEHTAADFMGRYLELEELVNAESRFENPIIDNHAKNWKQVEQIAEQLRKEWSLGEHAIVSVVEVLEDNGLKVHPIKAKDSFNGMAARVSSNDQEHHLVVLNRNENIDVVRRRFTALHELAHLILSIPTDLPEKEKEGLCHHFAGAVLIPKEQLEAELGGVRHRINIHELVAIKENYGISIQALLYRAKTLGYITNSYHSQLMRYISSRGWRKKEPGQFCSTEQPRRMLQLVCRGIEENIISLTKGANLYGMNLSDFRDFLDNPESVAN